MILVALSLAVIVLGSLTLKLYRTARGFERLANAHREAWMHWFQQCQTAVDHNRALRQMLDESLNRERVLIHIVNGDDAATDAALRAVTPRTTH